MLKKGWEALLLLALAVVAINLIWSSVQPYLPVLGITIIAIVGAWLVRQIFFRRRF